MNFELLISGIELEIAQIAPPPELNRSDSPNTKLFLKVQLSTELLQPIIVKAPPEYFAELLLNIVFLIIVLLELSLINIAPPSSAELLLKIEFLIITLFSI